MNTEVLHIGVRESEGTRVLKLTGELDRYSSDRIKTISDTWVNGAKRVSVNLDDLQYIDSAGLSALVWMWIEAKDRGVEMIMSCNNQRIYRVLEITGLVKLFILEQEATQDLAIRSMSSAGTIGGVSDVVSPPITSSGVRSL